MNQTLLTSSILQNKCNKLQSTGKRTGTGIWICIEFFTTVPNLKNPFSAAYTVHLTPQFSYCFTTNGKKQFKRMPRKTAVQDNSHRAGQFSKIKISGYVVHFKHRVFYLKVLHIGWNKKYKCTIFKLSFPPRCCNILHFGEGENRLFFFFLQVIHLLQPALHIVQTRSAGTALTKHCWTSTSSAPTLAERQLIQSYPAVVDIRT